MSGLSDLVVGDAVLIDPPVESAEQVIRRLAHVLVVAGAVRPSLPDAAVEREREHPTGLLLGDEGLNAALPHADREHVIRSSVAVAVLARPLTFHRMDVPAEEVPVRLVVLLALAEPEGQLAALRDIGTVLQHPDRVARILEARTSAAVIAALAEESA